MAKITKKLATPEQKAPAVQTQTDLAVPDYIKQGAKGRGLENVNKEDLILPRIKLLQPLSPEVADKGMKEGHFINSLTGADYGDSITFIAITHFKSRIYWQDRDEGGGMLCSSDNAAIPRDLNAPGEIAKSLKMTGFKKPSSCDDCPFRDWDNEAAKEKDQKPKCTIFYNFPAIVSGDSIPVAISMDRTKIRAAKRLLSMSTYMGSNIDMFAKMYKITAVKEKKDQYTYYNMVVEPAGFVSQEQFKLAEGLYDSFKKMTLRVEQEQPVEA
jgi:hypothetical protein